ncbi:hypothetical protein [Streptomyces sp. HUAS TT7]|uniref:hypothetical protein n=1 Tax=Streptomyces sp. HUAS TT7 TaxID=3447507 RepID=UPI003F65FA14
MAVKRALPAISAARETVSRALGVLLVLARSACSSQGRATSPQEVRELAGRPRLNKLESKLKTASGPS